MLEERCIFVSMYSSEKIIGQMGDVGWILGGTWKPERRLCGVLIGCLCRINYFPGKQKSLGRRTVDAVLFKGQVDLTSEPNGRRHEQLCTNADSM